MDLSDSAAEAAFRADVRGFLEQHAPTDRQDYQDEHADPASMLAAARRWQATLHEHGWASLTWPRAYGGRGLGPVQQIIWNQECGRAGIPESMFVVGIGMVGPTLIAHGSEAQKTRYLESMLRGEEVWCQLFSEPGAGSDLAAVATHARRDGDGWVVDGQKTWSSGAELADWGILLARTDASVPKHRGLTCFLLDMRADGIDARPVRQMNGTRHFCEVFLDGVRLADAQRLGEVGLGWKVAGTMLMAERLAIGGIERMFSLDALLEQARSSGELAPDLRDEIARLYTWSKSLELLNARLITRLSKGQPPGPEASVLKLAIARLLTRAADIGVQLQGPSGAERSGRWQNLMLYAPALHIAGGTDEIQKNIIAERVLGLPREPAPDRDLPYRELPRS